MPGQLSVCSGKLNFVLGICAEPSREDGTTSTLTAGDEKATRRRAVAARSFVRMP